MPIEETANMMIALAAIAQVMGTTDYIDERYWPLLNNWGTYLWETSEIPGDQVC